MKNFSRNYFQPSFLISFVLLGVFAGGMSYFKAHWGIILIKKPLSLKEPFDMLDEKLLEPYKVFEKTKIDNKDVLESLGTEEYLQWILEDTTVDTLSPVRNCSLLITYYTGSPDQVPHVPEACYMGGGFGSDEKFEVDLNVGDINIPGISGNVKIPATGLIFGKRSSEIWQASVKFPVIYFFKVNGQYKGNRTSVRIALGDLTSEYSYFSKIEVKFFNLRGLYPEKAQAVEATEKLLKVLLPVLEKNHWPEWK
ncbi:MAG: hypothetical protein WCE45_03840 [Sedimentisphaerales bacterium]